MNFALFLTEYSEKQRMHGALFYEVVAGTFPFALTAMARAIKLRWAATAAAAFFTGDHARDDVDHRSSFPPRPSSARSTSTSRTWCRCPFRC